MRAMKPLSFGVLLLAGCAAAPPVLRQPTAEVMAMPPEDDPRYSKPVEYPKELLNRPPVKPSAPGLPGSKPTRGAGAGGMPAPY